MRPERDLPDQLACTLEREWQVLCEAHLPIRPGSSMWWANRKQTRDDPAQGWKLHISATILSACEVFRLVAPCLQRDQVLFKAPKSLAELQKLNAGVYYGFSQAGKFITVYPPSTEAAVALARELDRLTAHLPAPLIAYDEVLRPGSCVYYRYGPFNAVQNACVGDERVPAMVAPNGRLIPDQREPGTAVPRWLTDPFRQVSRPARTTSTPLETRFGDYEAIVQRGRGGVYKARDFSSATSGLCIIKEGRQHGETDWLGRDGIDRIKREAQFLKEVSPKVRGVPRFITTFRADGCIHLVMEHVAGRTLQAVATSRERISAPRMLDYCLGMARVLADIHSAGWAWMDCKPGNFLGGRDHEVRAMDFEGACRLDAPDPFWLETPGYRAPKRNGNTVQADDLFALGVSLAQLVTRRASPPPPTTAFKIKTPWQTLPEELAAVTKSLLHSNPAKRPAARAVQQILEQAVSRRDNSSPYPQPNFAPA